MIPRGAAIPIMLTKNQAKIISVHFINKKVTFLSCYLLTAHKNLITRKSCLLRIFHMLVEKMFLPVAYVTECTFIGL